MATLPGKFGRFRVLDELGRGAMGVVYRAEDTALGRVVAIKTVALPGAGDERDQHERRFLQEARAAGSIAHPGIVTIYDVGREGDTAFMAMELVEGCELREMLRLGRVAPVQAVEIAAAVADALAHAHERGVIHRDIKPGNIMVLADGRVKLMDFGIARLAEPTVKTQTGMLLGSPQFMSPEQILGQKVDARSDVFSLGLVLYEMLTGTKPFGGDDIAQLTFNVCNLAARPPSHVVPALPPVLDFIVARAMKKKPEERYAGAADFARDLRACAAEVAAATVRQERSELLPTLPEAQADGALARTVPLPADVMELRPSPRFDSARGLERLAVLPAEGEAERSRGWASAQPPRPKRADPRRWGRLALYVAALLAAAFIVAACGKRGPRIEPLPADAVVLAFGDSLTFGTGAGTEESYPAQLGKRIGRKVVNAGVPGETSGEGLARLPEVLDEEKPQLLLLCHGGNDFLRRLDEAQAARNVRAMIELARARGIPVVLLATPKPSFPPSVPKFYAEMAAELAVPYEQDVIHAVLTDNRLKSDLVHPNGRGYAQVAEAVEKVLRSAGGL
jgi:lysophospholipase L1-like esterase/predicted Ser/Thr protein kinase